MTNYQETKNLYLREKVDEFKIRVPKGKKTEIQNYARQKNKSLNSYVVDLINADMSGTTPNLINGNQNIVQNGHINNSSITVNNDTISENEQEFIKIYRKLSAKDKNKLMSAVFSYDID